MRSLLIAGSLAAAVLPRVMAAMPDKVYGVNLGGWLLVEPWIIPQGIAPCLSSCPVNVDVLILLRLEWVDMGGDWNCTDCATCIGSELYVASLVLRLCAHRLDLIFEQFTR